MSHTMPTRMLCSNSVAVTHTALMQMVHKETHLIPMLLLLSSLYLVTFRQLVKILVMPVLVDHIATDLARLNLHFKMDPRSRPRQPHRMAPTVQLKALVNHKIKQKPK